MKRQMMGMECNFFFALFRSENIKNFQVSVIHEIIERGIYISMHVRKTQTTKYLNESKELYKSENISIYLLSQTHCATETSSCLHSKEGKLRMSPYHQEVGWKEQNSCCPLREMEWVNAGHGRRGEVPHFYIACATLSPKYFAACVLMFRSNFSERYWRAAIWYV